MTTFLAFVAARMKEASSYAGIAAVIMSALHISASPDAVNAVIGAIATVGGALAFFLPEKPAAATTVRALPFLVLLPLGLALSACAGGASNEGIRISQAASAVADVTLSAQDLAQLKATCQAAQPALIAATGMSAPAAVSGTAAYPQAFCTQLLAGTIPSTTNSGTPAWLAKTLSDMQIAAQIAGVALPAILPLL